MVIDSKICYQYREYVQLITANILYNHRIYYNNPNNTTADELMKREREIVTSQIVSNFSIYLPAVEELLSYKQ